MLTAHYFSVDHLKGKSYLFSTLDRNPDQALTRICDERERDDVLSFFVVLLVNNAISNRRLRFEIREKVYNQ